MGSRFEHTLHALRVGSIDVEMGSDRGHHLRIGRHIGAQSAHNVTAQNGHNAGTDGMGGVPHRHLGSQLLLGNPVSQQTGTRRESATLQKIVKHQNYAENQHHRIGELRSRGLTRQERAEVGTKAEGVVGHRTQEEADGHMVTRIDAVGNQSVQEARHTINHGNQRHDDPETGLGDAILGTQARDSKRKILPDKIKQGVTHHGRDDRTPLPILK